MTEQEKREGIREINALHGEVQDQASKVLDKAIRIGELLHRIKYERGHGHWLPWVNNNLSFSERTAQNYMRVFHNRAHLKSANVADLSNAYLLHDKSYAKSKRQEAPESDHSGLIENLR